jgi:hypothetical protein
LANEIGTYAVKPEIHYIGDFKETKTCKPTPVFITVSPATIRKEQKTSTNEIENPVVIQTSTNFKFEFENYYTEKAFNFLIAAFIDDYMRRRLALEKAGWRTFMEIAEHEKLSKSLLYGSGDRKGKVFIELKKRGLVEERFFPGERGRGGHILRLRVNYDKEIVKRLIDNRILKKKN